MSRPDRLFVFLAVSALAGCGSPGGTDVERRDLVVFAAASLRDIAEDLADEFERRYPVRVIYNFAGSNVLAQQIHAAPRADVFLSADERWVDFLADAGRVQPGTERPFLSNRLVVVARRDSRMDLGEPRELARASYRHLAVADPEGVPAGRYAKAYLERETADGGPLAAGATLWDAVADRVTPTLDVRAALALVESDPEILGIVYKTDAFSSERVRVLYEFPPADGIAVTYWAALVAGGDRPELGRAFLDFLASTRARAIVVRHGFGVEFRAAGRQGP